MDGAQDMGGMQGYGPVVQEPDEPLFHAEWERRAFALTLAMGRPGGWTIDMSRYARENRSPQDYLGKSYYELWLAGLERLMKERELIGEDEIEAGQMLHPPKPVTPLKAADVAPMLRLGGPADRKAANPALHRVGDRVRARITGSATHTRLPRYVRGHVGTIERVNGAHVFPDTNALGEGENPQWLYTVAFDSRDLWGQDGDASISIAVDAFEPYLESAG